MSRKKIIDLLKTSGKNNIDTKDLEECYTFELMIVMRKETTNEKIRERR